MHAASMTYGQSSRLAAFRPSALFVSAVAGLLGAIHRLDRWLVARGRYEPKTRAEVLEWARRMEHSDPGFAADLRAAALRDHN